MRASNKAVGVIRELFRTFMGRPQLLPTELHQRAREKREARGEEGQARVIADYIAGLSDRHILAEHRKIFDVAG